MLSNPEDAQDAVQETFLKAFKALDTFDGRSALSTWLHRITVTTCLMKLRTKRRKPQRSIEDLLPRFVADGHQEKSSEPWRPLSQAGIQDKEMAEIVRKAVEELPEGYREILMLRDVLGMSTEEAATVLEATVPLVKTRLHRARQALKALLEPYFTGGEA
jgi:RNA polymerase sigma-70 factor (ECF subfamily)